MSHVVRHIQCSLCRPTRPRRRRRSPWNCLLRRQKHRSASPSLPVRIAELIAGRVKSSRRLRTSGFLHSYWEDRLVLRPAWIRSSSAIRRAFIASWAAVRLFWKTLAFALSKWLSMGWYDESWKLLSVVYCMICQLMTSRSHRCSCGNGDNDSDTWFEDVSHVHDSGLWSEVPAR